MLEYSFDIKYIPGKENIFGDWASRHYMKGHKSKKSPEITTLNLSESTYWAKEQGKDQNILQIGESLQGNKSLPSYALTKDNVVEHTKGKRQLIVLPFALRQNIIRSTHNRRMATHSGKIRTRERIQETNWWEGMNQDIDLHINTCDECQKNENPKNIRNAPLFPLNQEQEPNTRVHLDLFGPLISDHSQQYFCVCTDSFSKFTNIWPIPNKNAETVAETFMANWVCLFGCPKVIITDGGKEFCNKILNRVLEKLDIKHHNTSPYHSQTNPQAETYNKTIIHFIQKFLPSDSSNWTSLLPYVVISHNSAVHSSAKVTLMQLLFSFPARIPPFDKTKSYS